MRADQKKPVELPVEKIYNRLYERKSEMALTETPTLYDAELRNAFFLRVGDQYILIGEIYKDTRGRFSDGVDVRTSYIKEHIAPDLFRTYNTTYKVAFHSKVEWAEEYTKAFMERFNYARG